MNESLVQGSLSPTREKQSTICLVKKKITTVGKNRTQTKTIQENACPVSYQLGHDELNEN